ncbi:MAG TPA: hypothetical protein VFN67_29120 [Polyangiales bacterium]|nr:hypothetical protein [Polyangiales bacterium]
MDMLIVERGANWSEWSRLTQTLRQPVRMIFQQAGETTDELYTRVQSRIWRADCPMLRRIVVLGAQGTSELTEADA